MSARYGCALIDPTLRLIDSYSATVGFDAVGGLAAGRPRRANPTRSDRRPQRVDACVYGGGGLGFGQALRCRGR